LGRSLQPRGKAESGTIWIGKTITAETDANSMNAFLEGEFLLGVSEGEWVNNLEKKKKNRGSFRKKKDLLVLERNQGGPQTGRCENTETSGQKDKRRRINGPGSRKDGELTSDRGRFNSSVQGNVGAKRGQVRITHQERSSSTMSDQGVRREIAPLGEANEEAWAVCVWEKGPSMCGGTETNLADTRKDWTPAKRQSTHIIGFVARAQTEENRLQITA